MSDHPLFKRRGGLVGVNLCWVQSKEKVKNFGGGYCDKSPKGVETNGQRSMSHKTKSSTQS
jgi:hypothetical protein